MQRALLTTTMNSIIKVVVHGINNKNPRLVEL